MALLYADENFPRLVVEELRRLGHDVVMCVEAGQANQGIADEAVLDFAHAAGRAVLTQNRNHFRNLHNARHAHSGIVICTVDADFMRLARRINSALPVESELAGQLIRINRPVL